MELNMFSHTGSRRRKHQNKFEFTRGLGQKQSPKSASPPSEFDRLSGPQMQAWVQPQGWAGLTNF